MSLFHKKNEDVEKTSVNTAGAETAVAEEEKIPESEEEMSPELKKSYKKVRRIDRFLSIAAFALVTFLAASNFLIAIVPTSSMYPTLAVKEFVLIKKTAPENLERGDICVFHHTDAMNKPVIYCKRMIALPGDTVEIKNNVLYVNGEDQSANETYCAEQMITEDMPLITMDEDDYFLMGDNRNNSADCRFFGPVQEEDLIGHSIFHAQLFNDPELDYFYQHLDENPNPHFVDPKPDNDKINRG